MFSELPILNSEGLNPMPHQPDTITTYVVKVASRCNLNCSYCYIYNLADSSWRKQPKFMSLETYQKFLDRLREYLTSRNETRANIVLHGGEPFLLGADGLDKFFSAAKDTFAGSGFDIQLTAQTNGLLIDTEICSVFSKHGLGFGVSIDGIPGKGDGLRVDHAGQPVGHKLEERLNWLMQSPYSSCLAGILNVVNIHSDPIETLEYLLQFKPRGLDFRLPLCHHDSLPERPQWDVEGISYGKWLAQIFDYAVLNEVDARIRVIDGLIQGVYKSPHFEGTIGNLETSKALIVESDGSYELADNLKSTSNLMTKTGLSVNNSIDEFSDFAYRWGTAMGLRALSGICQQCSIRDQCRGFFYCHRYSKENHFSNPSVYCSDLKFLFKHVNSKLTELGYELP